MAGDQELDDLRLANEREEEYDRVYERRDVLDEKGSKHGLPDYAMIVGSSHNPLGDTP